MERRRDYRNQRGVTLMEMMVSILASLIVVMALGRVMTLNHQAWDSHRDKSDVQNNAALILERMSRTVRTASTIEVTGGDSFVVRDGAGNTVHAYALSGDGSAARIQEDGVKMADETCTMFDVRATGRYDELVAFVRDMESDSRLAEVHHFVIRSPLIGSDLEGRFNLSIHDPKTRR